MADVRAFRSGNWSDVTATSPWWNGTAIFAPAAGDNVYSNTFTITVDVSVNLGASSTITNSSATSRVWKDGGTATATGGGSYSLNNGVTLTSNISNLTGNALCVSLSGTNSASIVGNITGGANNSINCVQNSGTSTLSITGNISGGSSAGFSATGVNNSSSGTINVSGNIVGGSGGIGIINASSGIISITGNVTGGSVSSGANNASTGTFTVIGNITATNGASGFTSSNSGATNRLSGSFISAANGLSAIYAVKYFLNTSPTSAKTRYALNGSSTYLDMFTADNSLGQASISDVRFGTVYASGALTGVAYIPAAASVAFGVPVDNTTGTATLTAADVRAAIGMASANLDTQLSTISTKASEVHAIHGLDIANALTVTPTLRAAGAITQAITGDGTTNTVVTRV